MEGSKGASTVVVVTSSPLFKVPSRLLAMKDHPEVCPLSRAVMSACTSTAIPFITKGPSLAPESSTSLRIGFPYGSLSPCSSGDAMGLTAFHDDDTDDLGAFYRPGGRRLRARTHQTSTCLLAFLAHARSHLKHVHIDDPYEGSDILTISSSLALSWSDAGPFRPASCEFGRPKGEDTLSLTLPTRTLPSTQGQVGSPGRTGGSLRLS